MGHPELPRYEDHSSPTGLACPCFCSCHWLLSERQLNPGRLQPKGAVWYPSDILGRRGYLGDTVRQPKIDRQCRWRLRALPYLSSPDTNDHTKTMLITILFADGSAYL